MLCCVQQNLYCKRLRLTSSARSTALDSLTWSTCWIAICKHRQLKKYDSVMVWSNAPFQNATLLGDVLADYVDSGRTVVAVWYSFNSAIGIAGRLRDMNYLPFTNATIQYSTARFRLVAVNRSHPLLNGVKTFDGNGYSQLWWLFWCNRSLSAGGVVSYHFMLSFNSAGGSPIELVANWDDNVSSPLIAVKGRVVGYF